MSCVGHEASRGSRGRKINHVTCKSAKRICQPCRRISNLCSRFCISDLGLGFYSAARGAETIHAHVWYFTRAQFSMSHAYLKLVQWYHYQHINIIWISMRRKVHADKNTVYLSPTKIKNSPKKADSVNIVRWFHYYSMEYAIDNTKICVC